MTADDRALALTIIEMELDSPMLTGDERRDTIARMRAILAPAPRPRSPWRTNQAGRRQAAERRAEQIERDRIAARRSR